MALATISGGGAFTKKNITDINSNFAAVSEPDLWVRPQYGNNATADGSYDKAFATIAGALSSPLCVPGVVIGLLGVTFEEVSGPIVNDVTIVGMANQPRQATTSGTANGGGATWLSPSGGTGTLLTINGQGWTVQNLFFNNTATGATTAAIKVASVGDPPAQADGSHARIVNCRFNGGNFGVYSPDGANFVTIEDCTFSQFVGSGDTAIKAAQSVRTLLGWAIRGCTFYDNVNHIVAALTASAITGNTIAVKGATNTTTAISLSGGADNTVMGNYLGDNATGAAATWTGGTDDAWCNFSKDDGVASGVPS